MSKYYPTFITIFSCYTVNQIRLTENYLNFIKTEIATLTHKFSSVTLYKNKTVRYAARMHAIMACQMEFQLYPMDIQICPIFIESCKWCPALLNWSLAINQTIFFFL